MNEMEDRLLKKNKKLVFLRVHLCRNPRLLLSRTFACWRWISFIEVKFLKKGLCLRVLT